MPRNVSLVGLLQLCNCLFHFLNRSGGDSGIFISFFCVIPVIFFVFLFWNYSRNARLSLEELKKIFLKKKQIGKNNIEDNVKNYV